MRKVHITPRVSSPKHDTWDINHKTPQVQLEDQSLWWRKHASGHLQSPKRKQQGLNQRAQSTLSLAINIHQPALDPPWTKQVVNKGLNIQKKPCPTEEKKKEKRKEKRREIRAKASWEFNSVTGIPQLWKHPCLALVWIGQHGAMTLLTALAFPHHDAACSQLKMLLLL